MKMEISNVVQFAEQVKQLEEMGFRNRNQNLKLLRRTDGNLEIVANFLEARMAFKDVARSVKQEEKINKRSIEQCEPDVQAEIKKEFDQEKKRFKQLKEEAKELDHQDEKRLKKLEKLALKEAKKKRCEEGNCDSDNDEKKSLKKEEKRARKEAKKQAKKDLKKAREEDDSSSSEDEKTQKKLEKQRKREQKALEKLDRKEKREQERIAKKQTKLLEKENRLPFKLPDGISKVLIDGNNLLYVLPSIRNKVIHRQMRTGADILTTFVRNWMKMSSVKECILYFDSDGTLSVQDNVTVLRAQPQFSIADDAIVDWAQKLTTEEREKWIVFTSDRGLTHRLADLNVCVGKSTHFFEVVVQEMSKIDLNNNTEEKKDLLARADELIIKQLAAMSL